MAKNRKVTDRPEKKTDEELFNDIEAAIGSKNYIFTDHAQERAKRRKNVSELQVIKILRSKAKYHENKKDTYEDEFKAWNYSVRGKSVDSEDVRIIISFDKSDMLIITVINLDE